MPKKKTMEDMHRLAEKRGGKCLSMVYVNCKTKLKWECSEGHMWDATSNSVQQGSWCPACQRNTMEDMHRLARKRDGKCLSDEYVNSSTKLKWQCSEGHTWDATPGNIQYNKTWCSVCADNQRKTIEDMQRLAEKRGGKCLSTIYINNHTKLKLECNEGHTWNVRLNNIQQREWCPVCANNQRKTMEDMRALAEKRGGKCLSTEYVNRKTKLKW